MSKKLTKEDIVERARAIHGDKYDYSLFLDDNFTFNGVREDMPIICPKHGVFNISISSHINGGRGCRKCANDKMSAERTMPFEEFERLSNEENETLKKLYLNYLSRENTKVLKRTRDAI
jgi:hypothetical protein